MFGPTVVTNGKTIPKSKAHWTQGEKHIANYNKATNAIIAVEFRKVSTCTSAKEAWDICRLFMRAQKL